MVKSLVLTGFGINCEEELAAAYRLAGAEADIVHLNDILLQGFDLHAYDILNFPGGFSFGDDIASGRVLANKIKYKQLPSGTTLLAEIRRFLAAGKHVMGICNGFQVLVKLGLLPNIGGEVEQEVTLSRNDSGKYENRWCYLKVTEGTHSPFLKGLDVFAVPVRHGEGKLIIDNPELTRQIVAQRLNCLSYCDAQGNITHQYPANPNGADLACAGLCDPSGQVFGLMPHPEAYLSRFNHPDWGLRQRQNPEASDEGEGLSIFRNIVTHIAQQKKSSALAVS